MLRRIAPVVLTVAVSAAVLTGCSSADTAGVDRADCTPTLGAGALSDSVVVLGGFGTVPEVSIPADTTATVSQRSIVDSASAKAGAQPAGNNTIASVNFAFYDQGTGEKLFESAGFGGQNSTNEFFMVSDESMNPLTAAIECAVPGERVVLALSPEDALPLRQQIGGTPEAALVAVMDVEGVSDLQASGRTKGLPNGFPAVVTDENGVPGVVLPPRDAPVGIESGVRIAGSGEKVEAEGRLLVQMLAVSWDGSVLSNTWTAGGPQLLPGETESAAQGLAFREELTGKNVGSQVVVTEGGDNARVMVIDILAVG
ncbi:peptidylprolyl isomerase [Leucobacter sp. NPDC015123]|uniref:peptidylprolyl isomerase n=1 Tax=Leucobacter sp. NPDC015123 TaxID=3364129 RepID=UPI0036F457FA